jgi:hypothetical protein
MTGRHRAPGPVDQARSAERSGPADEVVVDGPPTPEVAVVSAPTAEDSVGQGMSSTPVIRKMNRRATTQPAPGSDPRPAPEPDRHTLTENDDRLKAEKPPHY